MKLIILLFSAFMILICGCRSASSLDRKPVPKRAVKTTSRQVQKKRNMPDEDPLFNTIFHRKPQKFEKSGLSSREQELLREQDISKDPALRQMHRKQKKSSSGRSDWVFGTENGSYF